MSLLFIQHGDYAEAWRRFRDGGEETYRDQRKSVEYVAALAEEEPVTVLVIGEQQQEVRLGPRLSTVTVSRTELDPRRFAGIYDQVSPRAVICRTPQTAAFREANRRRVAILPNFADVFSRGPRAWAGNRRLRNALTGPSVCCVSNHSLNATRSLADCLGLPRDRLVPWDWSRIDVNPEPKAAPASPGRVRLYFAGKLSEEKGVGDCLEALQRLRSGGVEAELTLAGPGNLEEWRKRAAALGVANHVKFEGLVTHGEVRAGMRAHDAVLVPSRWSYPEGLPNTIYEALASRSPLILSDHPAFAGRVTHGESCLVFEAGRPDALAEAVRRLIGEPGLYARLSGNSAAAHDALYVGMAWPDLVRAFLDDPADRTGWVARNSLAALGL